MLRNLFVRHTSDDVDRVGHGYGIHVDVDGGDDDDERNYHEHHHISEVGTIFLSFLSNNVCGYDLHVDVDHAHDDGDDERNYHESHHIHFCGYAV